MFEEVGTTTEGDLIINMGPQHPATHGVLHLVVTLNGETIKNVEPHLGYIHRSIEKMCESLTYRQFIYVTSRMDYLSAHINNHACAMCVEKGLQLEVPPRAQVIRVLMDELTRGLSNWRYGLGYKLAAGMACVLLGFGLGDASVQPPVSVAGIALMADAAS